MEYKDLIAIKQDYVRIQPEDFDLIREKAHGIYVEVGTFHGASAVAASEKAKEVYTIDIYNWQPKLTDDIANVYEFLGTSVDFVWRGGVVGTEWKETINVLFIDGSHEFDSVKKDIEALEPLVKKGGTIMFHDYKEGSTGVWAAVNEYIDREKPTIVRKPTTGSSILEVRK